MPRSLTNALVIVVFLVWVANSVVGFFEPERSSPAIHGIFLAVIGTVWGLGNRGQDSAIAAARRRLAGVIAGQQIPDPDPAPEQEQGAP